MKKKRIFIGLVTFILIQGAIFAANGTNLVGLFPESRSMGGLGIGMPLEGHDTIHKNPAWFIMR